MDVFLLSLSLVFAIPILILIIVTKTHKPESDKNLPPGSFGWPFFGETLAFLYRKPDNFVGDRMRAHSPKIFKTNILGEKTVVFCGPSGNKFLWANEQKLVTAWRPHSMQKLVRSYQSSTPAQNPSVDNTKVLRSPGFLKPEALSRFMGMMDSITQQHMKMHWDDKEEVRVFPLSKLYTLTLASSFFMGFHDHDRVAKLVKQFDDVSLGLHCIPLNFPGTVFYRANKAATAIRKEILSIVKEKKEALSSGNKMHDILAYMILASDENGKFMPETEITDKIMGLLVAGYSTVATAIAFLMKHIGEHPDIYQKVFSEQSEISTSKKTGETLNWEDIQKMKYSWNVASEAMRLQPPLQGTFREAITDFTYEGFTIPKGWKIYWTVSSTNKNPEYFPDPENFDPMRYEERNGPAPYTYVPFGGGPRLCPGKDYGRLAILTFLHNVVKKYKWKVIFPDEKIITDMMPMPVKGVPVRLTKHST